MTSDQYRSLKARADASAASRMVRIRRLAREAGLDPSIPLLHAHNAHVSAQGGRPWAGVDYSKVRLIRRLERDLWAAHRIVDRLLLRNPLTPSARCFCPDDCACRSAHRMTVCGCRQH